jgi:short-subunit dehydrogenase
VKEFTNKDSNPGKRTGRLALVTGGSAGIGRTFCERLAVRGYDLIVVARDVDRLRELADTLHTNHSVRVEPFPADLSRDDDVTRVVERIHAGPPLDALVNNAGFGSVGTLAKTDAAGQEAMLRVHVLAPMRLTQAAVPAMVARGAGAIINVSSMASYLSSPGNVNYCATKAYLRVFSEGLAQEVGRRGVTVQALCPGFTHTEFHARLGTGEGRLPAWLWLTAQRVVEDSLGAMERGAPVVVVPGLHYKAMVLLLRLLPAGVIRRITGRYRRT